MGFFNPMTLTGYQERALEDQRDKMEREQTKRRDLSTMFERLSQDPTLRPEVRSEYEQRLATILLTPPEKKLPKNIEQLVTEVPTGIPQGQQPPQQFPATQLPAEIPPLPGLEELPGATMPAPRGPASEPARFTREELETQEMQRLRRQLETQGGVGLDIERRKRQMFPPYPEQVEGMIGTQRAFANRDPVTGQFSDPATGEPLPEFRPEGSGAMVGVPGTTPGVFLMEQFPVDLLGNPTDPEQAYRLIRQGEVVSGIVPTTASEVMMPVFDPVTQSVVYRPRSEVEGQAAPRTTYDISGMPSTGGAQGIALTAPPAISEATQADLASTRLAVTNMDEIMPRMAEMKDTFGPLAGRVTLAEVNQLGGMGATPEQEQLAIDLRRLVMTQAFENGGKQLTPTEKEEFLLLLPKLSDTLSLAMTKAIAAREYLADKYQGRIDIMPPRQRGQITAPPIPPLPGQEERVEVIAPDGTRGTIPASQLEAAEGQGYRRAQ